MPRVKVAGPLKRGVRRLLVTSSMLLATVVQSCRSSVPGSPQSAAVTTMAIRVVDSDSAPLPGAVVRVATPDGRTVCRGSSNTSGVVHIEGLAVGRYVLDACLPGFKKGTEAFSATAGRAKEFVVQLVLVTGGDYFLGGSPPEECPEGHTLLPDRCVCRDGA